MSFYYARYNPNAPQPTPVIEWLNSLKQESGSDLIPLTDNDWRNKELTPMVSGGVLVALPLNNVKANQIKILQDAYEAARFADISFTTSTNVTAIFQADVYSVNNISYMLSSFVVTQTTPAGFYWVAKDNSQVPFTYTDLIGLANALGNRGWFHFENLQNKKALVNAATTVADVLNITF